MSKYISIEEYSPYLISIYQTYGGENSDGLHELINKDKSIHEAFHVVFNQLASQSSELDGRIKIRELGFLAGQLSLLLKNKKSIPLSLHEEFIVPLVNKGKLTKSVLISSIYDVNYKNPSFDFWADIDRPINRDDVMQALNCCNELELRNSVNTTHDCFNIPMDITPEQIKECMGEHIKKIAFLYNSPICLPISVDIDYYGIIDVLDGHHRFSSQVLKNKKHIQMEISGYIDCASMLSRKKEPTYSAMADYIKDNNSKALDF